MIARIAAAGRLAQEAAVMKALLLLLLLLMPRLSCAQLLEGWRNETGNIAPDTDARKSNSGFGGMVLVTPDADWKDKWRTPSDTTPHFNEAHRVTVGMRLYVLTFFAGPKLDEAGQADVRCDFQVIRADGTLSAHQENAACFKGKLNGKPSNTYLAAPVIAFSAHPGDPHGEWVVHVTLRDAVRDVSVSLKTSFTVTGE